MIQGSELATILDVKAQQINNLRNRYDLIEDQDTVLSGNKRRYYTPCGIRKILQKRDYLFERKIVSVCNVKGGVGKTTLSISLAKKASLLGFKTLLIDCDKQANATDQLWPESKDLEYYCLYHIITKQKRKDGELITFKDAIVKIDDFLNILPSDLANQLLEVEIVNKNINKGNFFKKHLEDLDYDLVILDTEPNLSQINLMALTAADINISPIRLDKNSIDGLELILDFIEDQKEEWPEMKVKTKVIINAFDKRMTTEAIKKIGEVQKLGVETYQTAIRTDQSFVRSQESGDIKKGTKAYKDISNLISELLELDSIRNIQ